MGSRGAVAPDVSKQLTDRRSLDGRRVKARLIDGLLLTVLFLIVQAILGGGPWLLILLALEVTYFFVCEATWGYTLGKYQMGLRVIKPDGSPPGANAIAARNVVRIVEEPLLALLVMVGSGGRRQRIGDLVGTTAVGSVVYSKPPRPSAARFVYPAIWVGAAAAVGFLFLAPHDEYMRDLNQVCVKYHTRIASLGQPRFDQVIELEKQSTAEMASIDPPAGDRDRHEEIVRLKRELDDRATEAWSQAMADPNPQLAFRATQASFREEAAPIESRLYELGLTCRPG